LSVFLKASITPPKANAFMMERGLIPREVANYGFTQRFAHFDRAGRDNKAVVQTLSDFLKS